VEESLRRGEGSAARTEAVGHHDRPLSAGLSFRHRANQRLGIVMAEPTNGHTHPGCPLGAPATYGVGTRIHEELPGACALRPEEIPEQVQGRGGKDRPLASLQRALASRAELRRAWLVRKHLSHFPQDPLYVLVVDFLPDVAASANLLQHVSERLPNDVCGLIVQSQLVEGLLPRMEAMDGALIFERA